MRIAIFGASLLGAANEARAADWPQWRGPDGQGHAEGGGYPLIWSETQNVTWKTIIPGRGWSSPVIYGSQIWLTTSHETPASPEHVKERLKEAKLRGRTLNVPDEVQFRALCLDRANGKILRDIELHREKDPQWIHDLNTYASPTPVIREGRLFCHFGTFGTFCVDTADGRILWRNTTIHLMHDNGPVSSPVLWKNRLIFHADGDDVQFVAALDTETGALAWKTPRSAPPSEYSNLNKCYSTPLLVEMGGGPPVLVSPAAGWLYGYDPVSGAELWRHDYGILGYSASARPVCGNGMLFYTTGYQAKQMHALRWSGAREPEVAWTTISGASTAPSPLLVGKELLCVSDDGILNCMDARTGTVHYRERLGRRFRAAPLSAGGRCYFFGSEGVTHVVALGANFSRLAENRLDGQINASPAAVDGALFIRTDTALYRIEQAAVPGAPGS